MINAEYKTKDRVGRRGKTRKDARFTAVDKNTAVLYGTVI